MIAIGFLGANALMAQNYPFYDNSTPPGLPNNDFLKIDPLPSFPFSTSATTTHKFEFGKNYSAISTSRGIFYGGNLGISQSISNYGNYGGKWSLIGAYRRGCIPTNGSTVNGLNFLVTQHLWGDYSTHFGLRAISTSDVGNTNVDAALRDAVISWSYERGQTANRLIFQTIKGIDYFTNSLDNEEQEWATILSNGNIGSGIPDPEAQFEILPIDASTSAYKLSMQIFDQNNYSQFRVYKDGGQVSLGYSTSISTIPSAVLSVRGTGDDLIHLNRNNGDNVLKVEDIGTVTINGTSGNDILILNNASGTELLSMSNGGTFALPTLATSTPQSLYIDVAGAVYAWPASTPNPNLTWIPDGNSFGSGATVTYLGTKSYTDVDLIAGNVVTGIIHGVDASKRGFMELSKPMSINHVGASTNFPLTIRSMNTAAGDGSLLCYTQAYVEAFSVRNNGVFIWPGTAGAWHFNSIMAETNGNIQPANPGVDDIGSSTNYYANIFTSNLNVAGNLTSHLSPSTTGTFNLGSPSNKFNEIWGDDVYVGNVLPEAGIGQGYVGTSGYFWLEMNAGNFIKTSDKRLKTNIVSLNHGLKTILELKPYSYNYKSDQNKIHYGFIAQELRTIFPNAIVSGKETDSTYLGVDYNELIPILTLAIQEQQTVIDSLKQKLDLVFASQRDKGDGNIQTHKEKLNQLPLLFQNHPNPFSRNTLIDYFLPPNSTSAFLRVVDVNGKLIKAFPIGQTGFGQIELDCENLAAGTYFYTLIVNEISVASKSMVIASW